MSQGNMTNTNQITFASSILRSSLAAIIAACFICQKETFINIFATWNDYVNQYG